jgi:hypothetical protein
VPYYFEADSTNRIARCRFEGRLTDEELKECYRVASEIAALTDPRAGVVDLSGITSLKVSSRTILELANSPPIMPNPDRIRVIVAEPLHIYGMARMFGLAGQYSRPNLHVVRQADHAWAILGVLNPQFKPYKSQSVNAK